MAQTDETIIRQLAKPLAHLTKYFPMRIRNVNEQQKADRELMWHYKDGNATEQVAMMAVKYIKEHYGEQLKTLVFACIPASSREKNEVRFKEFSRIVCDSCGMRNAYDHIKVESDRIAIHKQGRNNREQATQAISYDESYFNGANILLWDDCITTGKSWAKVADKLEQFGANVIGGLFLGRTSYRVDKP